MTSKATLHQKCTKKIILRERHKSKSIVSLICLSKKGLTGTNKYQFFKHEIFKYMNKTKA